MTSRNHFRPNQGPSPLGDTILQMFGHLRPSSATITFNVFADGAYVGTVQAQDHFNALGLAEEKWPQYKRFVCVPFA